MRMSISTTSGWSWRVRATASAPSAASPSTSMSPAASTMCRNPLRTSAWSSVSPRRREGVVTAFVALSVLVSTLVAGGVRTSTWTPAVTTSATRRCSGGDAGRHSGPSRRRCPLGLERHSTPDPRIRGQTGADRAAFALRSSNRSHRERRRCSLRWPGDGQRRDRGSPSHSASTAKTHVSRLLMKLDAHDRAQLVMIAYETGLVVPG
jgi:hypothetical protein